MEKKIKPCDPALKYFVVEDVINKIEYELMDISKMDKAGKKQLDPNYAKQTDSWNSVLDFDEFKQLQVKTATMLGSDLPSKLLYFPTNYEEIYKFIYLCDLDREQ